MLSAEQIRAGRELLHWSQSRLAEKARVRTDTVARAERPVGEQMVTQDKLIAIQRALESAGVEFTGGNQPGVKLRREGRSGSRPDLQAT